MDKKKIEKFDKEQLELLLKDLQDIDKFTVFKDGAFKYELGKYQANLLVNCIKKQKEVIEKAIKMIEDCACYNKEDKECKCGFAAMAMTELRSILDEVIVWD